jgi:DNA-binding NarL/FixJ family response regulator
MRFHAGIDTTDLPKDVLANLRIDVILAIEDLALDLSDANTAMEIVKENRNEAIGCAHECGISMREIAKAAGVSVQTVANIIKAVRV